MIANRCARNRRRSRKGLAPEPLVEPRLWIIAPTVSAPILRKIGAKAAAGWPPGVCFVGGDVSHVGVVVASELPRDRSVPDSDRERILAETDPARIERWIEKASVATSLADVLDEPSGYPHHPPRPPRRSTSSPPSPPPDYAPPPPPPTAALTVTFGPAADGTACAARSRGCMLPGHYPCL